MSEYFRVTKSRKRQLPAQQPLHILLFHWSDQPEKAPGCFSPAGQGWAEWDTQSHTAHHNLKEKKTFYCQKPLICRVIKQDLNGVPGVWISALCMAGISLMRRSCISGGMVMERPWGYKRSDSNPSGSSHTWCCRPGKRSTRDSMEGQYLEKMRIFWGFRRHWVQYLVSEVSLCVCVCVPGALSVLLYVTIEMKTLSHHSLHTRRCVRQVTWKLLFGLF